MTSKPHPDRWHRERLGKLKLQGRSCSDRAQPSRHGRRFDRDQYDPCRTRSRLGHSGRDRSLEAAGIHCADAFS
ncbi:hypothetical protein [Nostoc sp.]|uniref:hypothetical protein n=1 Tax=Nostoc sp. TaxID=1180 RepID=UPI002FFACBC3